MDALSIKTMAPRAHAFSGMRRGMFKTALAALQRMVMIHAITKRGPSATYGESGFPIKDAWLRLKKGSERQGADSFNLGDERTAEFLWRAKSSRGDYLPYRNE